MSYRRCYRAVRASEIVSLPLSWRNAVGKEKAPHNTETTARTTTTTTRASIATKGTKKGDEKSCQRQRSLRTPPLLLPHHGCSAFKDTPPLVAHWPSLAFAFGCSRTHVICSAPLPPSLHLAVLQVGLGLRALALQLLLRWSPWSRRSGGSRGGRRKNGLLVFPR